MTVKFNGGEAPPEKRGADFPKLELAKNEVARINILTTQNWEATVRHYVQNVGYIHCHAVKNAKSVEDLLKIEDEGGRPDECPLCSMLAGGNNRVKLPQRRFGIRVLRYKTSLDGSPSPGGLKYWMEIWILGNRKYWRLQEVLREWGDDKGRLANHDLTLTCEDEKYQNMAIGVKKDALWKSAAKEITEYYKTEAVKYKLADCLGQTMDEEALKRRFATMDRRASMRQENMEEPAKAEASVEEGGDVFSGEDSGMDNVESPTDGLVPGVGSDSGGELDFLKDLEDE